MAEICFLCYCKEQGSEVPENTLVLSEEVDVCEQCGQVARVVVKQKWPDCLSEHIKTPPKQ